MISNGRNNSFKKKEKNSWHSYKKQQQEQPVIQYYQSSSRKQKTGAPPIKTHTQITLKPVCVPGIRGHNYICTCSVRLSQCTHPHSLASTNDDPLIKSNYPNLMCSSTHASRHRNEINKAVEASGAPDRVYTIMQNWGHGVSSATAFVRETKSGAISFSLGQ